jgi:hypothetical protein
LPEDYDDGSSFAGNFNGSRDSDVLPGGHWDCCLKGAMYVSYMDSIRLQKLLDDDGVAEDVVLDDAHVLGNSRFQVNDTIHAVQFIPVWPKDIVWTYTTDYDGAHFPRIPRYSVANRDTWYLWIAVSMLACIPSFWRATVNSVNVTSDWQGWMLSQTVQDCFMKFCRKDMKSNPFKLKMTMKRTNAIMAGSSSAEAAFDHNVIFSQFSLLQNVVTVWLLDLLAIWPSDDSNVVISKTKSVVMLIRHPSEENIELPEKLYSDNMSNDDNRHWELPYVVTTET